MLAFGLTLVLFAFWSCCGYAALALLRSRRNLMQNALLAPGVGLSLLVLLLFWASRAGVPIGVAGVPVTIVLALAASLVYWRKRPYVPWRKYGLFAVILLAAAVLTGRPMFEFGFDWASYCNDDMANYVLSAQRFHDHGYFDAPTGVEPGHNRDLSLYYYDLHVYSHEFHRAPGTRCGSELLLAWTMTWTGLSGHLVFMPVILGLQLALISSGAGFLYQFRRQRLLAALGAALLAFSALTAMGTVLQLIAQVFGLAVFSTAATLLMHPFRPETPGRALRHGLLLSIVITAAIIVYSELVPFLAIAFALYAMMQARMQGLRLPHNLSRYWIALAATVVWLNTYSLPAIGYMNKQIGGGVQERFGGDLVLFPHFLIPSGLAQLWGFLPVWQLAAEPWLSIMVFCGGLLLLVTVAAGTRLAWRGQPCAIVLMAMLAVTAYLIFRRADYGLFKMAMFAQPFLLGTLARAWLRTRGERFDEQAY